MRSRSLMMLMCLLVPVAGAQAATVSEQPVQAAAGRISGNVKVFFNTYCLACHDAKKHKGQMRLDDLEYALSSPASATVWQEILNKLNLGEMPPEKEKQPKNDEMTAVLASLTESLAAARTRLAATGGKVALRHLNQREYAKTLEALFGMRIPLDQVPDDVNTERFDTNGGGQYFTPFHLERYFTLGKTFVADALGCLSEKRQQEPTTYRVEPEVEVIKRTHKKFEELTAKMALVKQGKTWQEIGFDAESSYKTFVTYYDQELKRAKDVLEQPAWQTGVFLGRQQALGEDIVRMMSPGATYKLRVRGGIEGDLPRERTLLKLTGEGDIVGALSFNAPIAQPEIVEMEFQTKLDGDHKNGFHVHHNVINSHKQWQVYFDKYGEAGMESPVWIDWLEISGPYYSAPSFFETCLQPILRQKEPTDVEVKNLLYEFAYYCFRRSQPEKAYLDRLFAFYQTNRSQGLSAKNAIVDPLGLILASPQFLYLQESGTGQRRLLEQRQFAIRLAYFLWSTPPDEELYALAQSGTLYQPKVLNETIARMLSSPKAKSCIEGFVNQWAELKKFDAVKVSEELYQFMEVTRESARREPAEFVNVLVRENLPIDNLIASDFVVIDKALSVFYDIPGTFDYHFQKVSVPAGSPRGGLLGQAAFLVMGTSGERTSPVKRGTFVLRKFLDYEPPPPPPNVPALMPDAKKPLSMRETIIQHEAKPQCASCHQKIDPIGFGLENFDVIGLWRSAEPVGKEQRAIDATGRLPDGGAFADFSGLKAALGKNRDTLARSFYVALLSYGLGRNVEFTDGDEVNAALATVKQSGYRMRDLITSVATSPAFRRK